jgi:outer membrane protein assembly factor BamB
MSLNVPLLLCAIGLIFLSACASAAASPPAAQVGLPVASEAATDAPPPAIATRQTSPTASPVPTLTATPNEHVIWKFQTTGAIWGSPAVYQDTVFVGSDDGALYAVAATTGEQRWAFKTGGIVRSHPAIDAAAGALYFTSDDGYAYALQLQDGKPLWRADIGNSTERSVRAIIGSSPSPIGYDYLQSSPVVADGSIFIGSADSKVYALQADTGTLIWSFRTGAKVRATPTVVDGVLYVGSWDTSMYALDAHSGALRWQTPIGGQIQTTALVHGNLVYAASRKASVVALEAATGELVWEFSYGQNMWVESSPVLLGDTLFIGSSGTRKIFGLDPQTGDYRLSYLSGLFCWSRPLIVAESLFMGCTNYANPDQGLLVLDIVPDPADAKSLALVPTWQLVMGEGLDVSGLWSGVASGAVHADGVVYCGGLDGALYAVQP